MFKTQIENCPEFQIIKNCIIRFQFFGHLRPIRKSNRYSVFCCNNPGGIQQAQVFSPNIKYLIFCFFKLDAADGKLVGDVLKAVYSEVPCVDVGIHLHTHQHNWREKVDAAWKAGCRRFDGVMSGIGGCPMAGYELVGNLTHVIFWTICRKTTFRIT